MKKNVDCYDVDCPSFVNDQNNNDNKSHLNPKLNNNFTNIADAEENKIHKNLNSDNVKNEIKQNENKSNNCESEKLLVSDRKNSENNDYKNSQEENNDRNLNSDPSKATLDAYIDKIGFNRFQLFTIFIVCFCFFVDGSEMVIVNLILS